MVADAHLARHHHVVAGGRAAGHAHLRAEHVVPADLAVVGHHHQVVDLRALTDGGRPIGAAVDGCAGTDFHVGHQDHVAQLGRQHVAAVDQPVAEPIGAQHGIGVDHAAGADDGIVVQHGVGEDRGVLADLRAGHDVDAGIDSSSRPRSPRGRRWWPAGECRHPAPIVAVAWMTASGLRPMRGASRRAKTSARWRRKPGVHRLPGRRHLPGAKPRGATTAVARHSRAAGGSFPRGRPG